jgi:hypothetical protein
MEGFFLFEFSSVTNLIEQKGFFLISFTLKKSLTFGIEVKPSFLLLLNKKSFVLLKKVFDYFNCGAIKFRRSSGLYFYEIKSISDLVKNFIPHFYNYSLKGDRLTDFRYFEYICKAVFMNYHRSKLYLPMIIRLAYKMNFPKKRKHTKNKLLRILNKKMV